MESQFYVAVFYITIDTCVNSDRAKTINITFVLKIINRKSVSKTRSHEGDLSG